MEDQLFSIQNSDLNNQQLDEIEQKAQAKNTKKETEWGVKKFERWCDKRKLSVDFKTVSSTDVSEILRKFYAEVKTEKGQALTPSAWAGIRAAIHHHLICAPLSRILTFCKTANSCLPTKFLKRRPSCLRRKTMQDQDTNHLFSQETCRNSIDTSWEGRTRPAFGKMPRS